MRESRLTLPDGSEMPPKAVVIGRGPDLFLLAGRECYRAALA